MKCEIITVGTEILLGNIVNTNAQFLSRELSLLGISIFRETSVGDNPERLFKAFSDAFESGCDLVITTGGLGPTADDITKEVACKYLGLPLYKDEKAFADIISYLERTGKKFIKENEKQAFLPQGCIPFYNDMGTAPGFAAAKDGKTIIVLPGPPREMKNMFSLYAEKYLSKYQSEIILSTEINTYGIPESVIDSLLADLMKNENPTLAPYAKEGYVMLRVTARAETRDKAADISEKFIKEIEKRIPCNIFSKNGESMEYVLVNSLKAKGKKISVAESCTGGLISKLITSVPGASEVYEMGLCSYSSRIKNKVLGVSADTLSEFGAVSEKCALEMAINIRKISGADIGISVTGNAGPSASEGKEVGLIYIGVCSEKSTYAIKRIFGHGKADEREYIRKLAALAAMNEALLLLK